jgi:hypothetical protein
MADEKLEKRSKNVREQTRNISPEKKKSRIMEYIRAAGFRARSSTQDRFGVGKDQHELTWNPMTGGPEHELSHAIMTPTGSTLRDHQKKLGQVYTPQNQRGMTQEEGHAEEAAAFGMEPAIGRRAGVQIKRNVGGSNVGSAVRLPGVNHQRGVAELHALEEGRKAITPKGQVVRGQGVHAKINTRANLTQKSETMSDDLKKAGPPPIPAAAQKNPHKPEAAMPSPWDDEAIAPHAKPTPSSNSLGAANWMGKPILYPDHHDELEQNAAVNEFALKMARPDAEHAAYGDYVKRQRVMAAAHHLEGMKAAHAVGDMESARKHGAMYNMHSKALGHEPVGPAHPDVVAHMQKQPSKVYKFKAHKGDLFALDQKEAPEGPVTTAMDKSEREALYTIWLASQVLAKGEVVGKIGNDKGAEPQPKHKKKFDDIGLARAGRWAKEQGVPVHPNAPKTGSYFDQKPTKKSLGDWAKSEMEKRLKKNDGNHDPSEYSEWIEKIKGPGHYCHSCRAAVAEGTPGFNAQKPMSLHHHKESCQWRRSQESTKKAEMSPRAGKVKPCVCPAYSHPHRHGGGKCGK